jgi:uncharacterized protein
MKRILSLDGGGIRGIFTLEILLRMERLLREHYQNPKLVLADHFDFFAGASTGAIIATCLCWGLNVEAILEMYIKFGRTMFTRYPWYRPIKRMLVARYNAKPLSDFLQRVFSEDGEGKIPTLLGTSRLKKLLLVVMRNHSTGSAWPITNNPHALYNDSSKPGSNLDIPLWQVVRASAAAPIYFDPETIKLAESTHIFVDGAVTPYNNPALIAALTAILPCYRINWETGLDKIRIVSLGTIQFSSELASQIQRLWLGHFASKIPAALIQGIAWEQDFLCRCLGRCIYGNELDSEIGNLRGCELPGRDWFSYVRYNQAYKAKTMADILKLSPDLAKLDAVHSIPALRRVGREYGEEHVKLEHLI